MPANCQEINVFNHLPVNTSIHFHGIEQQGTPWSDGVAGLTQWAIRPGESFTYRWVANTYGTYWYHAHDKSTIMDGLYGAIRIRPSPKRHSPFRFISNNSADVQAMKAADRNGNIAVLSDWSKFTSTAYMEAMHQTGYDIFCSDSVLVNGQGSIYCKSPEALTAMVPKKVMEVVNATLTDKGCLPFLDRLQGVAEHHPGKLPTGLNSGCHPSSGKEHVFDVDPQSKWASFHFIGAASLKALVVSIDEHPMYVYEVDGHYIEPQLVHMLPIYNGERYSVIVKLDKQPGRYNIRVANDGANQVISGFATLSYRGASANLMPADPYINYAGQNTTPAVIKLDTDHLVPYPLIAPAPQADDFHLLTLGRIDTSWEWTLDGTGFLPSDMGDMRPYLSPNQSSNLPPALEIRTKNNTWVDIVFQLRIRPPPTVVQPPHPMHKHSNKAFLLGRGSGKFEWQSVAEAAKARPDLFLKHPVYRDTFVTTPTESWMAIRYHVVNPGPFLLHCHMETHLSSGMGLVLLDGVDAWPDRPWWAHGEDSKLRK